MQSGIKKKVLFFANDFTTIAQFRKELVEKFIQIGFEVYVSLPKDERNVVLKELGANIIDTKIVSRGKNPFSDLMLYKFYKKIVKAIKPDIVLGFTIKPNVYGGMACGKLNVPFVANITGIGRVTVKKGFLQNLTFKLYRKGLKNTNHVFFQNSYNLDFFKKNGLFNCGYSLIAGSGVNLNEFEFMEYPAENGKTTFGFIGRFLKEKGVNELRYVIERFSKTDKNVDFILIGASKDDSLNFNFSNTKVYAYQEDLKPLIKKMNAVILPSYGEGMANSLLIGCACGRPIIASSICGCKETFIEGESGFGVNVGDCENLYNVLEKFIKLDYSKKVNMGKISREIAEQKFNRDFVISAYMEIVDKILLEK